MKTRINRIGWVMVVPFHSNRFESNINKRITCCNAVWFLVHVQGFLYKKGTNSINRDWKKKYVVLLDDGRLIYHPSLHVRSR